MAEEWTLVRGKSSSKPRNRRHIANGAARTGNRVGGGSDGGLYGSRASTSVGGSRCDEEDWSERIKRDTFECLRALEGQLRAGNGFAHRLITSLNEAVSSSSTSRRDVHRATGDADTDAANAHAESRGLRLSDIVAYGIGNFSTERFRSPMLQLACLLLLRRCAASDSSMYDDRSDGRSDAEYRRDGLESFQDDQKRVPVHYYDPCILPIERELLDIAFHVHVLEYNDMGKRTNVLWAHWYRIFTPASSESGSSSNDTNNSTHSVNADDGSANDGSMVIFGNSFRDYEERTIPSRERTDGTNGVFIVAPFAREIPIDVVGNASKKRGGGGDVMTNDTLRHLEMAFNDCSVIYFPVAKARRGDVEDDGGDDDDEQTRRRGWPDRPREWFVSTNPDECGELK
ncbi:hypothetical protein ACHAW5_003749 [Stephanodiscus triporus]|uniref:SRR1-like domain-containing protein n=1 Tax=Stephanodiscus triporus TaxID=2934178 RepID=A0ABD3NKB3_9STRA